MCLNLSPIKRKDAWNRCDYCGKFISYDDFDTGGAVRKMVTPDSLVSKETYETYHVDCVNSPNRDT